MNDQKIVVGKEEWCSFPSLNIPAIKARIDSGMTDSFVHAVNIQSFTRHNSIWVKFDVLPLQESSKTLIRCEAPVVARRARHKESAVQTEKLYVVKMLLSMNHEEWYIDVILINRDLQGYRMILGREAMSGRIIVDPSVKFNLGQPLDDDLFKLYQPPQKSSSGLHLGLLASNPELYSNKRLMEAGQSRGHEMVFLNVQQCYMKLNKETPAIHYRDGRILNDLDAVVPRIRPNLTFYGCALTRHFESLGVYSLNSSAAISQSRDKLFSLQLLSESGLDIPTTGFANSPIETSDLIDMVGGAPLIIKLLEGTQGQGVVYASTNKAAESVITALKSLNANILVQEFIKEAEGKDLRCFVIDGKVVAAIERIAAPGEFRANLHQGGTAQIVKISTEERKLAVRAAKTLGLAVAGVDIIRSSRGPLLLEVNSSPGLEGIEDATGKDVAGLMIEAIEKKLQWQKQGKKTDVVQEDEPLYDENSVI